MTSRPIVIDSSAILAEIKDEPGAYEVHYDPNRRKAVLSCMRSMYVK